MHNDFVYASQIEGGPRGLINLGSTCYINSVIQCLHGFDLLTKVLCGEKLQIKNQGFIYYGIRDICKALQDTTQSDPFMPDTFLGVVSARWSAFEAGHQMDAGEFLSFLLSALHEELVIKPDRPNFFLTGDLVIDTVTAWEHSSKSAISQIFHLQLIGLLRCPNCLCSSGQYRDVNSLISVEVLLTKAVVSLEDCLQNFFMEEEPEDAKCGSCKSKGLRLKMILGRLPPVLIVQLKRFKRSENGSLQKINKTVTFTTKLDLKEFCVPSVHSSTTYELKSVVNHHGHSLGSGHYTALSKRGDRWYHFNDSKVTSSTSRHLCSSNAYLLFFEKLPDDNNNHLPFDLQHSSLDIFIKTCGTNDLKVTDEQTVNQDLSQDLFEEEEEEEFSLELDADVCTTDNSEKNSDQLSWDNPPTDPISDNHGNLCETSQNTANRISQCNHPNFDLDIMDPVLLPDDVPGAKLDLENLRNYNVEQLKWWLACRGLAQGGRKPELIQRILNHRHREGKIYPGVGKGKWYEAKRKKVIEEAYDSNKKYPMLPTGAVWKPFPSVHIPNKYTTDMALDYLKAIPLWRFSLDQGVTVINEGGKDNGGDKDCESDNEDDLFDFTPPTQDQRRNIFVNGTMKRATNFLDSGRVLTVLDCEKGGHYCVKAEVQASMMKQTYVVCIMISKTNGGICFAECCCKARALARCCHIFAVLLLISRHIERHGNEAVTSTGRRCYWLLPGTSVVRAPGVVRDKSEYYPKVEYHRKGRFDPRPTAFQTDDNVERLTKFMDQVQTLSAPILWSYHLIQPPTTPDEEMFCDVSTTLNVAEMCSYMLWNLNLIKEVSNIQPLHFPLTRNQSMSPAWIFERAVRIPASKATQMLGLVSSRSTPSGKINALRKHIWGLDLFQNDDMIEGMKKEPAARKAYTYEIKKTHPEWDVIETGMWVNPQHPQLSCSPDGIVVDVNGFVKLLEVKCPAVMNNINPANFETLPKKQLKNFCLTRDKENGKIKVRPSHKWYVQVQMSLDILQLQECDFVIYSETNNKPNKVLIVSVPYDDAFWNEKRERLKRIHRELIVPEFFLYKTVFKQQPRFLVYSPFHEEHDDSYFWYGEIPTNTYQVENENEGSHMN